MCVLCMTTGRCHKNVLKSVEIACTNLQLFLHPLRLVWMLLH
jgi:hypothetical protein